MLVMLSDTIRTSEEEEARNPGYEISAGVASVCNKWQSTVRRRGAMGLNENATTEESGTEVQ